MPSLAPRVGQAMPVGNEGAGVVVAAGDSPEAQALLGRTVGFLGGATYGEYCLASPRMCLPLPEGADPADGASSFVNPLTALGMVETMRREGHTGLVHTAIAFGEDVCARYEAYGWHVQSVSFVQEDGSYDEDVDALAAAFDAALAETGRPSFIRLRTVIAWPAPGKQGTAKAHGSALGAGRVEEPPPGHGDEPGLRIPGRVGRPDSERLDQRVLHRVLGRREVGSAADEDPQHTRGEAPEQELIHGRVSP